MIKQALGFDRRDYERLLAAVCEGGYKYRFFDDTVEGRSIFLRHDVDKSPHKALRMARFEEKNGVKASYFFLLRSPLYSLLEVETLDIIKEISSLGHYVGLHYYGGSWNSFEEAVPAIEKDLTVFRMVTGLKGAKVLSFHNPSACMVNLSGGYDIFISSYERRFMMPNCKYISDSNAVFREGCPERLLASGEHECVQLLIHPIWWMNDKHEEPSNILRKCLARRLDRLDAYLCNSNVLWQKSRLKDDFSITIPPKGK